MDVNEVDFFNGRYYTVGPSGAIYSTEDGSAWLREQCDVEAELFDIGEMGGQLVAVGEAETIVMRGAGADKWLEIQSGGQGSYQYVASGNGSWLAIGSAGAVTSQNGRLWTPAVVPGNGESVLGLAFGQGVFLAVTEAGYYLSPNGLEWASVVFAPGYFPGALSSLMFSDGRWMGCVDDGLAVSADGQNWAIFDIAHGLNSADTHLAFGEGRYFLTSPILGAEIYTSVGEESWEHLQTRVEGLEHLRDFAYGDAGFLFVRNGRSYLFTEESGLAEAIVPGGNLKDVRFLNGKFLAWGDSFEILISEDGIEWSAVTLPPSRSGSDAITSITFDGTHWVAVSWYGYTLKSDNLVDWSVTKATFEGSDKLQFIGNIEYAFGKFYAGVWYGSPFTSGAFALSNDGVEWNKVPGTQSVSMDKYPSVSFSGTYLLLDLPGAKDLYTDDGVDWLEVPGFDLPGFLRGDPAKGFGDIFVSGNQNGSISSWSPGSAISTKRPLGLQVDVRDIAWGEDVYVLVGNEGKIAVSADLNAFEARESPSMLNLNAITYGAGKFVAVGNDGTIVASSQIPGDYAWKSAARYADGWIESAWLGWLFDEDFPWVYHAEAGWGYQHVDAENGLYTWDHNLQAWLWTSKHYYPYMYVFGAGINDWAWFQKGSVAPLRWFYDIQHNSWIREDNL